MTIGKALEGTQESYSGHSDGQQPEASPRPFSAQSTSKWPDALAPQAYQGLVGEVVATIGPHTEADPVGILLDFLVEVGNAMGRNPHAIAEADRHGTNLNIVLVGETAKGRKGSTHGRVKDLLQRIDPEWADGHITGGLSSGEGLIWGVRDPIEKTTPVKEKAKLTGEYETEIVDQGVTDKRLLVVEAEFASTLKMMAREGNTLSPIIRQAWDSGNLRAMTKNSPARATGAHVSVIGHITKDELLRYLQDTEMGNGFANRILCVCTRRANVLPEGGGISSYGDLVQRLHSALEKVKEMGELRRDDEAKRAWAAVYPTLSEGEPHLFGAVTARAEANVLRLSVIYAALDGAPAIGLPHLKAALAVWEYCEASAKYVFGDAMGDAVADRILGGLRQTLDGLTRTDISALFGRNVLVGRLSQALGLLLQHGRARFEQQGDDIRRVERWFAS